MFFKLTHFFVLALTALCQDIEGIQNGNVICGKIPRHNPKSSSCNDPNYNSAKRFQLFGIDCCNTVAKDSMNDFQDIANHEIFSHLGSLTKDPKASFTVMSICTPEEDPAVTQVNSINNMFTKLSSTCKRYTDVMALKNQLQCHMFNSKLVNDARSNVTLKITQFLIALQTAATKLQKIERESGSSCVEFTARQYYHIYKSRFEVDDKIDLDKLINTINEYWATKTNNCCNWGTYTNDE